MVGKTPMKDWKAACRNAEKWERWSTNTPAKKQWNLRNELDELEQDDDLELLRQELGASV